ncbi:hypothetical protein PQX77_015642 [Marasmius sp. AFHP31]|nr:hypothetical protein PQX77_015642 [Marasmius sp. AFHP31]
MPRDQPTKPDFSHILTPDLYREVLRLHFPWKGPANIKDAIKFYFLNQPDNTQERFGAFHFRATKPISAVRPSIPDLEEYLPDSSDPRYPEHALALVCLLDQMPRSLYRGIDTRYTYMFFDETCRKVVKGLISKGVYPESTEEWEKRGYTFEDTILRKLWLYTPLVHSEDLADHVFVKTKIESMRKEVEKFYGQRDPARDTRDKDSRDTLLMSRLLLDGLPLDGSAADLLFWLYRVLDAHMPIIKEYGRYPYRNESMGRESTPREKEHLKATHNFGAAGLTAAEAEKLRREVEDGVWEDLSDKGPR